MVIDFHTHIFPDKIAFKALSRLSSIINLEPSMNGTAQGLRESMENGGVNVSVILPVVTDPHQFDSILKFGAYINETFGDDKEHQLVSFAGIHPACSDYKEKLQVIARNGFKGIKLHPDYQETQFDDISYMRIIYTASELGLTVVTHAGFDPYSSEKEFCTPDMALHVIKETCAPKLVLAHLGSNEHYGESLEKLCGQDVYLDTSYSILHTSEEMLEKIICKHGADKILFGSDTPWASQKDCVSRLNSLTGISQEDKDKIFSWNALKLLMSM